MIKARGLTKRFGTKTAVDQAGFTVCLAKSNGIPARRVDEVLGLVGLQSVARKPSKGFSLGMGQRLGIAGALLGDPGVLMFDEPVNGLDPEGILWIRTLMRRLAQEGRTVFVSSHLMSEMALTAEYLVAILSPVRQSGELAPWTGPGLFAVYTLVVLAAALVLFEKRDA